MLTEAGKNYIAREFGISNCWVYSGLSWRAYGIDGTHVDETGGTGTVVSRVLSGAIDRVELRSKTYKKADLTAANAGDVTLIDVRDTILKNDGFPVGETQYCAGAPPVAPEIPYKVVKIVPPTGVAPAAYVSDIEIPLEMVIGATYTGAVITSVTSTGKYKAELVFYRYPTGWDGRVESLPGASSAIQTETKTLNEGSQRLNWTWTVPNIPGDFVIVSRLYVE